MRTFIAIELPEEIKNRLKSLQERLKTAGADVKWVEPQNIHLTLKFLGETNDKKIKDIASVVRQVAENNPGFTMRISGLGGFPDAESPRVIWVGIAKGGEEIKAVAADLEERVAKLGIPKEKRLFSGHITIGRTRSALNLGGLVQSIKDNAQKTGEIAEFNARGITFFKSTLTPKGPTYEPIAQASFKTT